MTLLLGSSSTSSITTSFTAHEGPAHEGPHPSQASSRVPELLASTLPVPLQSNEDQFGFDILKNSGFMWMEWVFTFELHVLLVQKLINHHVHCTTDLEPSLVGERLPVHRSSCASFHVYGSSSVLARRASDGSQFPTDPFLVTFQSPDLLENRFDKSSNVDSIGLENRDWDNELEKIKAYSNSFFRRILGLNSDIRCIISFDDLNHVRKVKNHSFLLLHLMRREKWENGTYLFHRINFFFLIHVTSVIIRPS